MIRIVPGSAAVCIRAATFTASPSRVLVPQVGPDVADHDRAAVDAGADPEVDALRCLQLAGELVGGIEHVERGEDGALGVVLVRDRAPKNASSASPWSWAIVPS